MEQKPIRKATDTDAIMSVGAADTGANIVADTMPASFIGRIAHVMMGKTVTFGLAIAALGLGIGTFVVVARSIDVVQTWLGVALPLANLSVLLLLGVVLAGRLTRVWMERRRGVAGARLHVRLVMLFGVIAAVPAILMAVFAVLMFHISIQAWFSDSVRLVLRESLQASKGYLDEHVAIVSADAREMASALDQITPYLDIDPDAVAKMTALLDDRMEIYGLSEAVVVDLAQQKAIAKGGFATGRVDIPPEYVAKLVQSGDVMPLNSADNTKVGVVIRLDQDLLLLLGQPVDATILQHMQRTEDAAVNYKHLDDNRTWLQLAFAWIFAVIALVVLGAAVLVGLWIANQIARPIGRLIQAAERVRGGDLLVRVPEAASQDDVAGLSRAFNRMTSQLAAQRAELLDAYSQIDERRRFTEAVLSGVSAGVIGLDGKGRIELPNRAASELLGIDLWQATGQDLPVLVPEFESLFRQAAERPRASGHVAEIQIGLPGHRRTLLARVTADIRNGRSDGFVVTFDDITELQVAQRNAAWADVARRIAHEIKNPLTPIQLSAERLKRRFTKEITSDPETFAQCADTIVRHVGDIGRMVDEFSRFARMPQPQIRPEDIGRIAREVMVLRRIARPDLDWQLDIPEQGPIAPCDSRLLREALTNLLQNAEDAVAMAVSAGDVDAKHIALSVTQDEDYVHVMVKDDGIGLPQQDRDKLTEPYVTHKPKGTGLGLAIVKKIMEDHGGEVLLDDRPNERGALAVLTLKRFPQHGKHPHGA